MDFKNKKILIAGMAKSGIACAKVLYEMGADITIYDREQKDDFFDISSKLGEDIEYKFNIDPVNLIDGMDYVILSPGISINQDFAKKAKQNGTKVIGEIELGYLLSKAPIICITGTNGKTTTTALTGAMVENGFKDSERKAFVLGNIGTPIVEQAQQTTQKDIIIAEVAGFQLESTEQFRPISCAFLNISQDHLDRFFTMEAYIASKTKMFDNQTDQDFAILNLDDTIVSKMGDLTKANKLFFSTKQKVENGAFVEGDNIYFSLEGDTVFIIAKDEIFIPGEHNVSNALAAICLAKSIGIPDEAIRETLKTFQGVEHRIEGFFEFDGIKFINDSKGTNPDSTIKAIEAMKAPTVLILGGSNKDSDYLPVFNAFNGIIKKVVALGETRYQILRDAKKANFKDIIICEGSFDEAVKTAIKLCEKGDNLLLSPACASYDMFDNFEQRGKYFKELVKKILVKGDRLE